MGMNKDEKRAMYSSCSKKELIDMLIEANKIIDNLVPRSPIDKADIEWAESIISDRDRDN